MQAQLLTDEWEQSHAEVAFSKRLIDGLGADSPATLIVRRWLLGKKFLPDGFELDGVFYGHLKPFDARLEVQLENLLFFFVEFRPIVGWDALNLKEKSAQVRLLEETARAFASALDAQCAPHLPSLLEYIPDEDGERLLRGAFRQVDRDIEHVMGATEVQRPLQPSRYPVERYKLVSDGLTSDEISNITDEDIYVVYVANQVETVDSFLIAQNVPTKAHATIAREIFDGDLFAQDEGGPFDFGPKFASYLRAFADNVRFRVPMQVRSARPNTNATAKQLAMELREYFESAYGEGEYAVGVIAALSNIWFAAMQADIAVITGPKVTTFLRPTR